MAQPDLAKTLLDFEEARSIVAATVGARLRPAGVETVDLMEAQGRVTSEDILADRDYPAVARSLRDGFAVRSEDLPGRLRVRGETRAGEAGAGRLDRGEAWEIMTGAPIPSGANAVVMVEHVAHGGGPDGTAWVQIDRSVEVGQWINSPGTEAKRGALLIPRGTRLDASHIAALAMVGHTSCAIYRAPTVAILSTGDELVDVADPVAAHQIRNSNSLMLAACVRKAGGKPAILPIARDSAESLASALEAGFQHDLLLVSGGVSAGKYDLVKPALRERGAAFAFERVRIQPGQPTVFGMAKELPVFGLPGNPGSTLVTFALFAQLALGLLAGEREPMTPLLRARFAKPFRHKGGLTRFLPARLLPEGDRLEHIPWQGSSDVPALARSTIFLVANYDRETWDAGDEIRTLAKP